MKKVTKKELLEMIIRSLKEQDEGSYDLDRLEWWSEKAQELLQRVVKYSYEDFSRGWRIEDENLVVEIADFLNMKARVSH